MTTEKPHQQIEWVPIVFVVAACYIVTLLVFGPRAVGDAAMQIAGGIATTFAGAAAGAYGSKMLQQRAQERRVTDAVDPTQQQHNEQ